jgi:transposase-like protein
MPRARKYPVELLDRATRLVFESGRPIAHVAADLGLPSETLRKYVRQEKMGLTPSPTRERPVSERLGLERLFVHRGTCVRAPERLTREVRRGFTAPRPRSAGRSRVLTQNPLEGFKPEPARPSVRESRTRAHLACPKIERTETRTRASVRLDVRQGRMLFYLQIEDVCLRA